MKFLFISLLVLNCLILTSCYTDPGGKKTIIKGRVYNFYTYAYVPNCKVELWNRHEGGFFYGSQAFPDLITQTDSLGYFEFSFTTEEGNDYKIQITKTDSLTYSLSTPIEEGKEKFYHLVIKPYIPLALTIHAPDSIFGKMCNIGCYGDLIDPYATHSIYWDYINGEEEYPISSTGFIVSSRDTTVTLKVIPHFTNVLSWVLNDTNSKYPKLLYRTSNSEKFAVGKPDTCKKTLFLH